jgi:XRE family aerobic/anaerobic benzoate catabolism transcriptional regulator
MLVLNDKKNSSTFDTAVDVLIDLVGTRVRLQRKAAGWSRRELSERSGVSLRYLAQLEAGEGNISIGLLQRIAMALQTPIEGLIAADAEQSAQALHVAKRFLAADAVTQARTLSLLDPDQQRAAKAQRVCLIGLRGAGKSTLGALVAQDLGVPFVELNKEVEQSAGIPASEIFALYSDEGYRPIEAEELGRIVAQNNKVILAVGGGIVSEDSTFAKVISRFQTVWIKAQAEEHMSRVRAQGDLRPMAGNPQAMRQLNEILKEREAGYAQADYQLDTSGKRVEESLKDLKDLLRARVFDNQDAV